MILDVSHMEPLAPAVSEAEFNARVACVCALTKSSVTGGMRTTARNLLVGGNSFSRHLLHTQGWGVDVVPDDGAESFMLVSKVAWLCGLWPVVEGTHVHIQNSPPSGRGNTAPELRNT